MIPTPESDKVVLTAKNVDTGEVLSFKVVAKADAAKEEALLKEEVSSKYLTSGLNVQVFKVQRL